MFRCISDCYHSRKQERVDDNKRTILFEKTVMPVMSSILLPFLNDYTCINLFQTTKEIYRLNTNYLLKTKVPYHPNHIKRYKVQALRLFDDDLIKEDASWRNMTTVHTLYISERLLTLNPFIKLTITKLSSLQHIKTIVCDYIVLSRIFSSCDDIFPNQLHTLFVYKYDKKKKLSGTKYIPDSVQKLYISVFPAKSYPNVTENLFHIPTTVTDLVLVDSQRMYFKDFRWGDMKHLKHLDTVRNAELPMQDQDSIIRLLCNTNSPEFPTPMFQNPIRLFEYLLYGDINIELTEICQVLNFTKQRWNVNYIFRENILTEVCTLLGELMYRFSYYLPVFIHIDSMFEQIMNMSPKIHDNDSDDDDHYEWDTPKKNKIYSPFIYLEIFYQTKVLQAYFDSRHCKDVKKKTSIKVSHFRFQCEKMCKTLTTKDILELAQKLTYQPKVATILQLFL